MFTKGHKINVVPVEQRFWAKVKKGKVNECWNWTGAKKGAGYGHLSLNKAAYKSIFMGAHRFSWLLHFGEIPKEMIVCHKCDNMLCVNPKHLFLGTRKDNTQDMVQKNRNSNQFYKNIGKSKKV